MSTGASSVSRKQCAQKKLPRMPTLISKFACTYQGCIVSSCYSFWLRILSTKPIQVFICFPCEFTWGERCAGLCTSKWCISWNYWSGSAPNVAIVRSSNTELERFSHLLLTGCLRMRHVHVILNWVIKLVQQEYCSTISRALVLDIKPSWTVCNVLEKASLRGMWVTVFVVCCEYSSRHRPFNKIILE